MEQANIIRAKRVYEFHKSGDPMGSLGAGVLNRKDFSDEPDFAMWIISILPYILGTSEIPEDILATDCYSCWFKIDINPRYSKKIYNFIKSKGLLYYINDEYGPWFLLLWYDVMRKKLLEMGFKPKSDPSLMEFHKTTNPIGSLRLGRYAGLDMYKFPELKDVHLLLESMGYNELSKNEDWYSEFDHTKNDKTSFLWRGKEILWRYLFNIELKSTKDFESKYHKKIHLFKRTQYGCDLYIQKLPDGTLTCQADVWEVDDYGRLKELHLKNPEKLDMTTIDELLETVVFMINEAEKLITKRLHKVHAVPMEKNKNDSLMEFHKTGDPLKSLRVGKHAPIEFQTIWELADYIVDNLPKILNRKYLPLNILDSDDFLIDIRYIPLIAKWVHDRGHFYYGTKINNLLVFFNSDIFERDANGIPWYQWPTAVSSVIKQRRSA